MNTPNLPAPPPEIANRQRRRLLEDAATGLGIARPAHVSIRGGQFALVRADGARMQLPTTYFDFVVVDVLRETSRVMFPEYVPGSEDPPICFSDNGVGPSTQALQPQSSFCETCQWNVRGSDQTFSGKDTTACQKRKKLAVIIPGDPQLNIYEFQIGPGTLGNFKAYTNWIGSQAGELDLADFVTRASWDPNKQFTMKFEAVGWANDPQTMQKLAYIEQNNLGDAVVNRLDKPCEPEAVARMLASRGSTAALPAPAAPAPQQFSLPPPPSPSTAMAGPAPAQVPPHPHAQGSAPSHFQPPQQGGFGAPQVQQWQPAPGQVAETRQEPAQTRTRKPRTPKGGTPDPAAQGFQAPAQAVPGGFTVAPAQQPGVGQMQGGFQPPGFVAQQLPPRAAPGPGTRLQEAADYNPAPPAPQFGMQQAGAPPSELEKAMGMLPPRQ